MTRTPYIKSFSNGLTLIVEEMPTVKSAAYSLIIPGGIVQDDPSTVGASIILTELTAKGAGKYNSRELSEAFDNLGARHGESTTSYLSVYGGSLLAENLEELLPLVSMMVRTPHLPEGEIDNIKNLLMQDIRALKDNPARRVINELSARYYPSPYNRPSVGDEVGLAKTKLADLKTNFQKCFSPKQSILSIAGNVKATEVTSLVESLFGDWSGPSVEMPTLAEFPTRHMHHIQQDAAQLQIALAYPSVKFGDTHYYASRIGADVLSGGMFGRLFIEVREKRGLCYTVYLSTSSTALSGVTLAYAGTTPERAQETLDVMLKELHSVKGSVTEDELKRSKANIKASLVMAEESSSSRAGSNATDWWWLKRIRTLDEIQDGIQKVGLTELDNYFSAYPCDNPMVVTLGAKKLAV